MRKNIILILAIVLIIADLACVILYASSEYLYFLAPDFFAEFHENGIANITIYLIYVLSALFIITVIMYTKVK